MGSDPSGRRTKRRSASTVLIHLRHLRQLGVMVEINDHIRRRVSPVPSSRRQGLGAGRPVDLTRSTSSGTESAQDQLLLGSLLLRPRRQRRKARKRSNSYCRRRRRRWSRIPGDRVRWWPDRAAPAAVAGARRGPGQRPCCRAGDARRRRRADVELVGSWCDDGSDTTIDAGSPAFGQVPGCPDAHPWGGRLR